MKGLISLCCFFVLNSSAQTAIDYSQWQRPKQFLGIGYCALKCFQEGTHWFTYYYAYPPKFYHGINLHYQINGEGLYGFHGEIRYDVFKYTCGTTTDHRYYWYRPNSWQSTSSQIKNHIVTIGSYFTIASADADSWIFFEAGPEIETSIFAIEHISSTYLDSAYQYYEIDMGREKYFLRSVGIMIGMRIGFVSRIQQSPFFWSLSGGIVNVGFIRTSPISQQGRTILLNLSFYYERKKGLKMPRILPW